MYLPSSIYAFRKGQTGQKGSKGEIGPVGPMGYKGYNEIKFNFQLVYKA